MKEPKDKRTTEYKEWKKNYDAQSKGLGDTVEKFTKATGIKKAVEFLAGQDCGCRERQNALNKLFHYPKVNCLTEEEFNYLTPLVGKLNTVEPDVQERLLGIFNRVFNQNEVLTNCGQCFLNNVWKQLEKVYNQYV